MCALYLQPFADYVPVGMRTSFSSGSYSKFAMLEHLLTEQPNPASEGIDALPTEQILRIINSEDQKVAEAVERELAGDRAGRGCDCRGTRARRPAVLHRRRDQRAAGRAGCRRVPAHVQRSAGPGAGNHRRRRSGAGARHRNHRRRSRRSARAICASRGFTASDVLVGIAASGRTPYVLGAVARGEPHGRNHHWASVARRIRSCRAR